MYRIRRASIAVMSILALASCTKDSPAGSDTVSTVTAVPTADAAADEQAIRAVNAAWFQAYQSGNVDGVVASYSDDAVVNAPGAAPARGAAAIRAAFAKEVPGLAAAGLSQAPGSNPQVGVSGDLGYEWNTYTVTDKSGKTVDTGKYVSVFARRDGKWVIISDIWNSDMPAAPVP